MPHMIDLVVVVYFPKALFRVVFHATKIEPSNAFREEQRERESSGGTCERMDRHPANTGGASGLLVAADGQHTIWPTNSLIDRADRHTKLLH